MRERIQNQRQALIGDYSADKQVDRNVLRQVIRRRCAGDRLLICAASFKIHAVWHDPVVAPVAKLAQVLPCAAADHPYLVAGLDIVHHGGNDLACKGLDADDALDIDVILCVIGVYQRRPGLLAHEAGKQICGGRAMHMEDIWRKVCKLYHSPRFKRISGTIAAGNSFGPEAAKAHHRIG